MTVANQDAFEFHKATGFPLLEAVKVLEQMEPLLRERVIKASQVRPKRSLVLRDPIESDPSVAPIVEAAAIEAREVVASKGPLKRGSSHAIWREQARILSERHQITWFSPHQMNPGVAFD